MKNFWKKFEKYKKSSYPYLPKNTINESFEDIHKKLENLEHNPQVGNALLDKNLKGKDRIIINPSQDFRITRKENNKGKKNEENQYMTTDIKELEKKS